MPKEPQRDFDEELNRAIAQWRSEHGLRENDAVLLLVDLFRIHQRHWDEMRHRDIPSFEQFRADLTKLTETARMFERETTALRTAMRGQPPMANSDRITLRVAVVAALASLLAGYLIGRAF